MAKPILPSRVTAICLLTALFGVCVMNPVEESEKLFEKLNAAQDLKSVEQLLAGVQNPDSVNLRGNTVTRLLILKDKSKDRDNLDCSIRLIRKDYDEVKVYSAGEDFNNGLKIFCEHYFDELLEICAVSMVEEATEQLEQRLDEETRSNLFQFNMAVEIKLIRQFNKRVGDEELVEFYETLKTMQLSQEDVQTITSSCEKLAGVLPSIDDPEIMWPHFNFKADNHWHSIRRKCWMFLPRKDSLCGELVKSVKELADQFWSKFPTTVTDWERFAGACWRFLAPPPITHGDE